MNYVKIITNTKYMKNTSLLFMFYVFVLGEGFFDPFKREGNRESCLGEMGPFHVRNSGDKEKLKSRIYFIFLV